MPPRDWRDPASTGGPAALPGPGTPARQAASAARPSGSAHDQVLEVFVGGAPQVGRRLEGPRRDRPAVPGSHVDVVRDVGAHHGELPVADLIALHLLET